jgi:hypothetical protein
MLACLCLWLAAGLITCDMEWAVLWCAGTVSSHTFLLPDDLATDARLAQSILNAPVVTPPPTAHAADATAQSTPAAASRLSDSVASTHGIRSGLAARADSKDAATVGLDDPMSPPAFASQPHAPSRHEPRRAANPRADRGSREEQVDDRAASVAEPMDCCRRNRTLEEPVAAEQAESGALLNKSVPMLAHVVAELGRNDTCNLFKGMGRPLAAVPRRLNCLAACAWCHGTSCALNAP